MDLFTRAEYSVIYADPPWDTGYVIGGKEAGTVGGGKELPYDTMTDEEIAALPVRNIAADDCLLFMWVIDSRLPKVKELMSSWGFRFVNVAFVWNKSTLHDPSKVRTTLSPYTRRSCEFCCLGVRGKAASMVKDHYVLQFLNTPSLTRQHSKKPDEVKDRIVRLVGDVKRIELFARQKTEGWNIWGNELENDIELAA
jgi:N6-adenosine-specific RNA methylase IME4